MTTQTPVDHVLQWYMKTEANDDDILRIGRLRHRVREDGLSALSDKDIKQIEYIMGLYEQQGGDVDLQPTRNRLAERDVGVTND